MPPGGAGLPEAELVSIEIAASGLLALVLGGLPCPIAAGWNVERQFTLPRSAPGTGAIGGFSALHYNRANGSVLLLNDLPRGSVLRWAGLTSVQGPQLEQITTLRAPAEIDGEGLVVLGNQWWVASEGRRRRERPAQLLRFSATSGALLSAVELPAAWQPGKGTGLASNAGPESLVLLSGAERGLSPVLLMAAEQPLLQDPPFQVRVLRWQWPAGANPATADPEPRPQGALRLPRQEGWGLTDLMVLQPNQMLGLLRRFEAPDRWQIRLALYPVPPAGSTAAVAALAEWDLVAAGLTPDNWEGLSMGPPLPDGRSTLLLVSDDNLNPLQANRLALITANRNPSCQAKP